MKKLYKSLPGWTYTSEAFFELEKNELILKNWQLVCHISNIPKAGDYFTFEIFNERSSRSKLPSGFHTIASTKNSRLTVCITLIRNLISVTRNLIFPFLQFISS